jgi:hypothetical protein
VRSNLNSMGCLNDAIAATARFDASWLPGGHQEISGTVSTNSTFQKSSGRCCSNMCFKGHESDPDIWLTIENGRYVPAPPMVYVPGLRQIQDRLHRRAHPIRSPFTSDNDFVRLPTTAVIPTSYLQSRLRPSASSPIGPQAKNSMQPSLDTLNLESISPISQGQDVPIRTSTSKDGSSEMPRSTEAALEKPPREPPGMTGEVQQDERRGTAFPSRREIPDSTENSDISLGKSSPRSLSGSSPFSLRSILKKPSSSNPEEKELDLGTRPEGIDDAKTGMEHQQTRRPRIKKTVSFTEEKCPASSSSVKTAPSTTAASEGAAIAKRLVQKNRRAKCLERGSGRLGGGVGSADLGHRPGEGRRWGNNTKSKAGA